MFKVGAAYLIKILADQAQMTATSIVVKEVDGTLIKVYSPIYNNGRDIIINTSSAYFVSATLVDEDASSWWQEATDDDDDDF